jgi:hypothetical protein
MDPAESPPFADHRKTFQSPSLMAVVVDLISCQ